MTIKLWLEILGQMVMLFTEVTRQEESHFEEQRSCLPPNTHRTHVHVIHLALNRTSFHYYFIGSANTLPSPSLQHDNNWFILKFMLCAHPGTQHRCGYILSVFPTPLLNKPCLSFNVGLKERDRKLKKGRVWWRKGRKKERKRDNSIYKSNHVIQLFKIFNKVSILYILIFYNDHILLQ